MKDKKHIDSNWFTLLYKLCKHVLVSLEVLKVCIMIDLTQSPIVHIVSIDAILH